MVPLFYERWQGPVPRRWVQRVKHSLVTLGPFVTAARMVRDYTEQLYEPTAAQGDGSAPTATPPRASWPGGRPRSTPPGPACTSTTSSSTTRSPTSAPSGWWRPSSRSATSDPTTCRCSCCTAPPARARSSARPEVVVLEAAGAADDGHLRYRGRFTCEQAGRYGITVRIVPTHPALVNPVELGKVAWA